MARWSRWFAVWGCLAVAACDEVERVEGNWEDTGFTAVTDDPARLAGVSGSPAVATAVDVALDEALYVVCERLEQNACRGNCDAHKYCLYNGGTGACECVSNNGEVGCADVTAVTSED